MKSYSTIKVPRFLIVQSVQKTIVFPILICMYALFCVFLSHTKLMTREYKCIRSNKLYRFKLISISSVMQIYFVTTNVKNWAAIQQKLTLIFVNCNTTTQLYNAMINVVSHSIEWPLVTKIAILINLLCRSDSIFMIIYITW